MLLGLIAMFICCYIGAILIIMMVKNISTVEAKKMIDVFLKNVFVPTTTTNVDYGICIGLDSMGCPMADVIEGYFEPLRKVFKDFYLANCTCTQNHYIYSFVVDEPTEEMDDESLYKYCLRICNNIIHRALHKENPWFGSIQDMVVIKLHDGLLEVFVAKNENGRKENIIFKRRMRLLLEHSNKIYSSPIEEGWNDN